MVSPLQEILKTALGPQLEVVSRNFGLLRAAEVRRTSKEYLRRMLLLLLFPGFSLLGTISIEVKFFQDLEKGLYIAMALSVASVTIMKMEQERDISFSG